MKPKHILVRVTDQQENRFSGPCSRKTEERIGGSGVLSCNAVRKSCLMKVTEQRPEGSKRGHHAESPEQSIPVSGTVRMKALSRSVLREHQGKMAVGRGELIQTHNGHLP